MDTEEDERTASITLVVTIQVQVKGPNQIKNL